jgi:hypothetical protein
MNQPLRATLLAASALLMTFGALGYTLHVLPDIHGDLVEISARPTLVGSTMLYLNFTAIAMFGFALMVAFASVQALRGVTPPRAPLAVVALIYAVFGLLAFSRSHSPHHIGLVMAGALLAAALALPNNKRSVTT